MKEANIDCRKFTNGKPGRHWYEAFMKRHSNQLSKRVPQYLSKERHEVGEEDIREWFTDIKSHLQSKSLLNIHPSRIYNCDETNMAMTPKSDYVIAEKGARTVYDIVDAKEHEGLTALFVYSAEGVQAPPMTLYPYKERVPRNIVVNLPTGWAAGISDNGWMTIDTFYEYVTNIFYPWLLRNRVEFPVILYLDGHSSHVTIPLVRFCRENQIELISLVPHSTHITQPLDISFFGPLKQNWKKAIRQWKKETRKSRINRENFAVVLEMAVNLFEGAKKAIVNGFKSSGLVPLDPNAIDYKILDKKKKKKKLDLIDESSKENAEKNSTSNPITELELLEKRIPFDLLQDFQKCENSRVWTGNVKETGLFTLWLQIKAETLGTQSLLNV